MSDADSDEEKVGAFCHAIFLFIFDKNIIPFFTVFLYCFAGTTALKNADFISFLHSFYSVIMKIKSNSFLHLFLPDDEPFSVQFSIPAEAIRLVGK